MTTSVFHGPRFIEQQYKRHGDVMINVLQIKNGEKLNEYCLILAYLYQSMVIARTVMEVGVGPENIGT